MTKDMSTHKLNAALMKHGFRPLGFMGYYEIPRIAESKFKGDTFVSVLNAPRDTNRSRLAYLLKMRDEHYAENAK